MNFGPHLRSYRSRSSERGTIIILLALALVPLLGLVALSVDGFLALYYKNQQINNAEYAAVAALRIIVRCPDTDCETLPQTITDADQAAKQVGGNNFYVTQSRDSVSQAETVAVELGRWFDHPDPDIPPRFVGGPGAGKKAVRATLDSGAFGARRFTTFFARMFGFSRGGGISKVIAYYDETALSDDRRPVVLLGMR